MTEEFAKIVNRLARARNFEDGSFCLITSEPNADNVMVEMKGKHSALVQGIGSTLKQILSSIDDKEAVTVREFITNILIKDEQKRFQGGYHTGKWIFKCSNEKVGYDVCRCSECGKISVMDRDVRLDECPYCLADMQRDRSEAE